jgi:hypothetical protein
MFELPNRAATSAASAATAASAAITPAMPAAAAIGQFGALLDNNGRWMKQFLHGDRRSAQRTEPAPRP